MVDRQTLEFQQQKPPTFGNELPDERRVYEGSLLGNEAVQYFRAYIWHGYRYESGIRESRSTRAWPSFRLEILKRRRFNPEDKAERVARSLAALNAKEMIHLSAEDWRRIAEDPDIEDLF